MTSTDYKIIAVGIFGLLVTAAGIFSACANAEPTDGRGNTGIETRDTGAPDNPRGFGSVTSQRALDDHDIGEHVRDQATPHVGLGNGSANDGALAAIAGVTDTGTRPSDHGLIIGALSDYDATARPGTHPEE